MLQEVASAWIGKYNYGKNVAMLKCVYQHLSMLSYQYKEVFWG